MVNPANRLNGAELEENYMKPYKGGQLRLRLTPHFYGFDVVAMFYKNGDDSSLKNMEIIAWIETTDYNAAYVAYQDLLERYK